MMRDTNVIELNSARDRLRNRPSRNRDDKRMHARIESDDRLFVQVVLSAADPDLVGTTVSCTAINLSVGGIQFRTDAAIPTGALLDLWVDIRSRPGKFFLAGEVRWTRPANDAGRERPRRLDHRRAAQVRRCDRHHRLARTPRAGERALTVRPVAHGTVFCAEGGRSVGPDL